VDVDVDDDVSDVDGEEIDYEDVEQFDESYDDGDYYAYEEGLYHGY
jgi:hypothetical protein